MRIVKFFFTLLFILSSLYSFSSEHSERTVEEYSDLVILPAGTVVEGDYFAMGDRIGISGTVKGDVYVSGGQIFIDGRVEGDVLAAAGSIDVSGEVINSIRAIAGQIQVSGYVGHNITVVAGNAEFTPSAKIRGNLVCGAGNVDLAGYVGSNVSIAASNLRISSKIDGNLQAFTGDMRLTSKTHIGGNAEYRSNTVAFIDSKAKIDGVIIRHPSMFEDLFKGTIVHSLLVGSKVAALLMNFLYTLAVGLILIRIFPRKLETALDVLHERPWKALAYGVLLLVLLPLVSLILLMTILGVPFALTLIALNIIGFYTAKVFTIFWASDALSTKIGFKKTERSLLQ